MRKLAPEVSQGLVELGAKAHEVATLEPLLIELIKMRASQLNNCAFCLDMHYKDARALGETEERLYMLAAWREASRLYSEREQAALALTEAVTVLTDGFVPDEVYEQAAKVFDDTELATVIWQIAIINTWNRVNVTARTPFGAYRSTKQPIGS